MSPFNNQYGFQLTDEGLDNFCAKVNIEVQYASEQAIAAIERNGGVITTAWYDAESLLAITNPMKFFTRGNLTIFQKFVESFFLLLIFCYDL